MNTIVLCLPPAGGTAAAFRPAERWQLKGITFAPLELPGRGKLAAEPLATSLPELAERLARALEVPAGAPVALLGHSMGALVAFELAHLLTGKLDIRHLFALASPAPELTAEAGAAGVRLSELDDDRFLAALQSNPAIPAKVRAERELLELALPMLRADFRACETYQQAPGRAPLSCPVTALTGRYDQTVTIAQARQWGAQTSGAFRHLQVPAGHDVLSEAGPFVARCVGGALA